MSRSHSARSAPSRTGRTETSASTTLLLADRFPTTTSRSTSGRHRDTREAECPVASVPPATSTGWSRLWDRPGTTPQCVYRGGRPPYGGPALVLHTEPRQAGSRPWRASIPVAETATACPIRSARSLSRPRVARRRRSVAGAVAPLASTNPRPRQSARLTHPSPGACRPATSATGDIRSPPPPTEPTQPANITPHGRKPRTRPYSAPSWLGTGRTLKSSSKKR